jgi:hypothetical protein
MLPGDMQGASMIAILGRLSVVGCIVALAASNALSAGCGGSEEDVPGNYAEPCAGGNTPCAMGLMCVNNLCTLPCTSANICQPFSNKAICDGYCYEPCMTRSQCPNGLICNMVGVQQGTCRAQ